MSQTQLLHHVVAERFRTVATLIGTPASAPLDIDGQAVVPGLGLFNAEAQLRKRADRLQQGHLLITAIGAVSRGKSTLLNACLGAEIFPMGLEAVTGGICRVIYGHNSEEVTLVEKGGGTRPMNRAAFNAFISLSSDKQPPLDSPDPFPLPARLENLQHVKLHSDSPLCERGISFVDTLGFNAGPEQEYITQRFLRQADMILMVLRTAPLFDQQDQAVINIHYQEFEGIGNMFFVANDFGTLSDEEKRVLMEETAPARLRNFFTGADGAFDQALFDRRVFMVNAKEALAAQHAGATGDALEATGFPALESAFHRILDEGEHLRIATDAAVARILLPSLAEAHTAIQRQRGRLDADAAAFEPAVREAQAQFTKLTQKAHDLRTTIESSGQRIAAKAATHFGNHFVMNFIKPTKKIFKGHPKAPWYEDWDSLEFGKLLSLKNVAHAAISKAKRDALARGMQERLQGYIESRMEAWQEEVTTHLQPDIDAMIAKTEAKMEDFVLQLDEIQEFVADSRVSDEFVDMDKRRGLKAAQMVLGVAMFDLNQVTGPLLDAGWKPFIVRLVGDIIAAIGAALLASLFTGPLGWVVFFGTLLVGHLLVHKGDRAFMMNRVRDKIGTQFHKAFAERRNEFAKEIQTKLEQQFTTVAENLQVTLDTEIAAAKLNWDAAAEARREGQAAVDKEITRLETIDSLLTAQFEELSMAVYGRVLTPEEQKALVERFTFSKDEDDA